MRPKLIEKIIRKHGGEFPKHLPISNITARSALRCLIINNTYLVVEETKEEYLRGFARYWLWFTKPNERGEFWEFCPQLSNEVINGLYNFLVKDPEMVLELI